LTEDSQFYCFQGLTNDKRFYISFFAPVKTRGIPKGDFLDSVASVKKMPPKSYIPNLEILDKMICSLEIK